jgi:hypothetical protein
VRRLGFREICVAAATFSSSAATGSRKSEWNYRMDGHEGNETRSGATVAQARTVHGHSSGPLSVGLPACLAVTVVIGSGTGARRAAEASAAGVRAVTSSDAGSEAAGGAGAHRASELRGGGPGRTDQTGRQPPGSGHRPRRGTQDHRRLRGAADRRQHRRAAVRRASDPRPVRPPSADPPAGLHRPANGHDRWLVPSWALLGCAPDVVKCATNAHVIARRGRRRDAPRRRVRGVP